MEPLYSIECCPGTDIPIYVTGESQCPVCKSRFFVGLAVSPALYAASEYDRCKCGHVFAWHSFHGFTRSECHGDECECSYWEPATDHFAQSRLDVPADGYEYPPDYNGE